MTFNSPLFSAPSAYGPARLSQPIMRHFLENFVPLGIPPGNLKVILTGGDRTLELRAWHATHYVDD